MILQTLNLFTDMRLTLHGWVLWSLSRCFLLLPPFFYCLLRFVFTCYSKEAEQVIPGCWLGFLSTCALPKQTDSGKKCILTKICSGRSLTALATGVEVIYKWVGNRYCSKCLLDKLGKAFPSHKTTNLHPWSSLE